MALASRGPPLTKVKGYLLGGRETGMEGGRGRERGEKITQKHTHCNGLDVIPTAGYENCYSRVHTLHDQ